ncbi:ABC transporter permease [Bacteroides sp.]|uniref:ABC transporter permease n=1 Tax=Bacteroides sp. TaxID=29523 RepID=UPI003AB192B9
MKLIRLSIRTLCRFKVYTTINIVGLALSLACVIVISRYVRQESSVDCYSPSKDRIGVLVQEYKDNVNKTTVIGGPFEDADIEVMSTFMWINKDYIVTEKEQIDVETIVADSLFLKATDLPMKYGKTELWASHPQTTFITEELSEKLFGTINPIGKAIQYSTGDPLIVTGVISKEGGKRSLHFDMLVPETLQENWDFHFPMNIALIRPGATFAAINKRHATFQQSPRGPVEFRYQLLPMREVYFHPAIDTWQNMLLKGNRTHLNLLVLVAALILIVGIFNFMSLYTVVLLKRGKEFGLKKVFGNNSRQLFTQLYAENFCLTLFSLFIAWFFVEVSAQPLNHYLEVTQQSGLRFNIGITVAILCLLPLLASIYPYLKFRYNAPIHSLQKIYTGGKSIVIRNLYLGIQYIVTFTLIVVSLFFAKQLYEMTHAELGYKTESIVKVNFERYERKQPTTEEEYLKQKDLRQSSEDRIRTSMNASPLFTAWNNSLSPYEYFTESPVQFRSSGASDFQPLYCIPITDKEIQFHGFHLIEGRLWNADIDHEGDAKLILSRKAMQLYGFTSITDAQLEPQTPLWPRNDLSAYQIIGVIEDFYCGHLSKPVLPIAFTYGKTYLPQIPLQASIVPGHQAEALAFLEKLHRETAEGAFNYTFAKDEVENLYKSDRQTAIVYSFFALMAILISSIGLFGLSLFDIQQRYREIALRKVNGATTKEIMPLLLKKYAIILIISFIIAIPISYWGITIYLESYAYKASLSAWLYLIAAIIVSLISVLTIYFQVRKAVQINPAEVIKSE